MTSFVREHGRQCMPCSARFSMTPQTGILSIETSDFLKHFESFSSVNLTYLCPADYSIIINRMSPLMNSGVLGLAARNGYSPGCLVNI